MDNIVALLLGWLMDLCLGDPSKLPHPVVYFGKAIARGEHLLNRGNHRKMKGGFMAILLISLAFVLTWLLLFYLDWPILKAILIFYCLAGTTLIKEVRDVFLKLDESLEAGRKQVARIVGRDTSQLSAQEVRQAALETLAENLSDGVVAPLFWLAILGVPGMMMYKMINTLDSMIGYRTERYRDFGCIAARIDDIANWLPARITAFLMLFANLLCRQNTQSLKMSAQCRMLFHYAKMHLSPNSGWPEAALAIILDCRFGGPHVYFGELIEKPYIGSNPRQLSTEDMKKAIRINRMAEIFAVAIVFLLNLFILLLPSLF